MKHVATMHVTILRERDGAKDEPDVRLKRVLSNKEYCQPIEPQQN